MGAPYKRWSKRYPNEEVAELRALLEEERQERENMLREHAKDNERKENVIRKLGDKFGRAQQQLDQEKKEKEIAEKENAHLRKLLDSRVKQLQNPDLQSRSTVEELQLSSSRDMASAGGVSILDEKAMTNPKLKLSLRDEKVNTIADEKDKLKLDHQEKAAMKRMFKESEEKRALLKIQMEKIERDHDETITALENCFEEMKVMSGSNKAKESYRRAIFWEANRCLARQRNAYLRNCKKMATELHMLQTRVKELEFSKASTGDINGDDIQNECESFDTAVVENATKPAISKVEKFRHEYEKESMDMEDKLKKEILDLNKIISEQEYIIACLRKDADCQMANEDIVESSEEQSDGKQLLHVQNQEDFVTNSFRQFDQPFLSDESCPSNIDIPSHRNEPPIEKRSRDEDMLPIEIHALAAEESLDSSEKSREIKEDERVDISIETVAWMPGHEHAIKLEDRESILSLEDTVEKQEATINLLNINCHMLEKAIIAKDKELKDMMIRMEQLQYTCKGYGVLIAEDGTRILEGSSVTGDNQKFDPVDDQALRTELNCLRLNTTIETEIMKDMIRVLNTQLYKAVKASEQNQAKSEQTSSGPKGEKVINEEMGSQEQLESLHKRSQTALQLSQAEVAALKQQLGKLGSLGNKDPYNITFEWIKY